MLQKLLHTLIAIYYSKLMKGLRVSSHNTSYISNGFLFLQVMVKHTTSRSSYVELHFLWLLQSMNHLLLLMLS